MDDSVAMCLSFFSELANISEGFHKSYEKAGNMEEGEFEAEQSRFI